MNIKQTTHKLLFPTVNIQKNTIFVAEIFLSKFSYL